MRRPTHHTPHTEKGFSLLETVVAIGILSLAMSGVFSLVSLSIRSVSASSNQLTAFFLASEAIEYIRNIRDNNIVIGAGWLNRLEGCHGTEGCFVDIPANTISRCPSFPGCPRIRFPDTFNRYNHTDGDDTLFTRQILISTVTDRVEVKVTVVMSWQTRARLRSFTLEERLFNRK